MRGEYRRSAAGQGTMVAKQTIPKLCGIYLAHESATWLGSVGTVCLCATWHQIETTFISNIHFAGDFAIWSGFSGLGSCLFLLVSAGMAQEWELETSEGSLAHIWAWAGKSRTAGAPPAFLSVSLCSLHVLSPGLWLQGSWTSHMSAQGSQV